MRCTQVLSLIDEHVDGLLPAPEAEALRDHLDLCEACRAMETAARAASTSLAAWGDLEPPDGCFESILTRIDSLPPDALERPVAPAPRRLRLLPRNAPRRWAAAGAMAAAAAWMVAVVLEPGPGRAPVRGPSTTGPTAVLQSNALTSPAATRLHLPGEVDLHSVVRDPLAEGEWVETVDGLRRRKIYTPTQGGGIPAMPVDFAPSPEGPR